MVSSGLGRFRGCGDQDACRAWEGGGYVKASYSALVSVCVYMGGY